MEFERAKNSKRNILYGIVSKFLVLFLPFMTRTVIIKELGANYLGLNGLFTSILSVLNMAELGFSSAIVYSMYKPVAENDIPVINALLKIYRMIYRVIGTVIFIVGLGLIPFLPKLVNGDIPNGISMVGLYLIYLVNTTISYFAFAYKRSILSVYQREDILSKITMLLAVVQNILQIGLIFLFHNYYLYALVLPLISLLSNFSVAMSAHKRFPQLKCRGVVSDEIKSEIKRNMKGLVIAKVGGVSRNAFDNIFISVFLGLVQVAIYNNYYYISNAVTAMMTLIVTSITASIGNAVATESAETNYNTFTKINFIYMWLAGWCTVCLLCLYQPFMMKWVGAGLMLPIHSVILFCVYFYALKLGDIQSIYLTTAGLFYEFRICAIIQAVLNIGLDYLLGKYFGINGIIFATVISIFAIDFLYGNRIVFRYYFKNGKEKEYYLMHAKYAGVNIAICIIMMFICNNLNIYIRSVLCLIVPNVLSILFYRRSKIYKISVNWLLDVIGIKNKRIEKVLGL